ncbi:glycosyltransferase family 2 protein, partial [candidate division KSB1 bacterium]|nr:glycosyltransferase family 2 protein [candidate division KSB1 bacterium]
MRPAFWLSIFLLIYVYGGFSLLIIIVGRLRQRHVRKQEVAPTVSLIIAAYNEEENIAARL